MPSKRKPETDTTPPHARLTKEQVLELWRMGHLTASGYLYLLAQAFVGEGWPFSVRSVSSFCEEWDIPSATFYRAKAKLIADGLMKEEVRGRLILRWNAKPDSESVDEFYQKRRDSLKNGETLSKTESSLKSDSESLKSDSESLRNDSDSLNNESQPLRSDNSTPLNPIQDNGSGTPTTSLQLSNSSFTSLSHLAEQLRESAGFEFFEEERGEEQEAIEASPPPPQVKRVIPSRKHEGTDGDPSSAAPKLEIPEKLIRWFAQTQGTKYAKNSSPRGYAIGCLKTQADIDYWMEEMLRAEAVELERQVVAAASASPIDTASMMDQIDILIMVKAVSTLESVIDRRNEAVAKSGLFIRAPMAVTIGDKIVQSKATGKSPPFAKLTDVEIAALLDWLEEQ